MNTDKESKREIFFLEENDKQFNSIQDILIKEIKKKSAAVIQYTTKPVSYPYSLFGHGKQDVVNLRTVLVDDFFIDILRDHQFVFGIGKIPKTKDELKQILNISD